jgi:hypothetical protein
MTRFAPSVRPIAARLEATTEAGLPENAAIGETVKDVSFEGVSDRERTDADHLRMRGSE